MYDNGIIIEDPIHKFLSLYISYINQPPVITHIHIYPFREELRFYTCEYRRMQPNQSLSGLKFDDLILNLEKMIRSNKSASKQVSGFKIIFEA